MPTLLVQILGLLTGSQGLQTPASKLQLVVQPTANAWACKSCLISSPTPSYTTGYADPVHALRGRTASRDRQRTAKGSASKTAMTCLGIAMASLAMPLWRSGRLHTLNSS